MRRSARIASSSLRNESSYTDSESDTPRRSKRTSRTPNSRRSISPRKKSVAAFTAIPPVEVKKEDEEVDTFATTTGADLGNGAVVAAAAAASNQNSMHYSGESISNGDARKSVDSETEFLKKSEEGRSSYEQNGRASSDGNGSIDEAKSAASGVLQATVPEWFGLAMMISLIFGGCCSNVFALEAIIKEAPDSGHLITFAQFLLVSIEGFIAHFDWNSPTLLVKNQIPIRRWLGVIILFFSVSVLNNWAFEYNISVPIHIILRSGGSITTMLIGACLGKRFSKVQILSVLILTGGIILSAMSNAKSMGESEQSLPRFLTGLSILFVSQILAALMGVYIENTYAKYGSNWREGLFYTHALSLPLFIPFAQSIKLQFYRLHASEPLPLPELLPFFFPDNLKQIKIPKQLFYLGANAVTQYICVRGVNFLAGMATALTVTIVLNIRKLVSLLLSIWLFGNQLGSGVITGATVVFLGAFVYGLESQRQGRMRREAAARREAERAIERKEYTN
ncbi:golgi uridine diphosphate-N- acetylglucosamine transporter [Orbilia oligospora]|uniref:Golgi uridine diphosphate-N-acetylglucosamine transporter n=1 Tax=Orbilia oligospora TaxID=2813651 RepID=A0A7C8K0L7_ORBOL|nr:golgi uridine diphosphate-N- acetylglucosamine transporter [Orbilia oligospora]KAF3179316.1 golgi uridine diphosphate-N- acetylglucosamine transporter [Orbilia oligospora]KAF3254411.1 golgi uridine diphosphate-N- acetylglucosamine transporter [Orbilia oligospora]KAF3266642.1 golgi uridine diphosphate-N- acetylglucosamine transporter [Orbilia oligospora]KAF3277813.1 golgi uridine diphosphate-N- acetylglucosamine transporter [Orbilia oligospora]